MLVQLQGPPLSNPTCLPTYIYSSYINCIHHLPTSPTSYSTAHATTRPPPLLLTPGVHHTPRWPRPRRPAPAPPRPAVKEPDNGPRDPDRRPLRLPQTPKSSLTRSAFGLRRPEPLPSLVYHARSVPPPSRDPCASAPPSSRLRSSSPPSRPPSPLPPCLLHKVHTTRPKPPRLRLSLALPPAHAHPHPPWLIIVHLYYSHGPPRPATTRTRLQRAVQPRMPHRPDTPCCHVPYWRLCNMRVRPTTA